MDREKINEAARAKQPYGICSNSFVKRAFIEGFEQGASWLMIQPLADRLTEEEKEKIIKRYKDELEVAQHHTIKMKESTNPTSRQFHANVREGYISRLKLLEQIFGADLFQK